MRNRLTTPIPTTKYIIIMLWLNVKQGRLPPIPALSFHQITLSHVLYITMIFLRQEVWKLLLSIAKHQKNIHRLVKQTKLRYYHEDTQYKYGYQVYHNYEEDMET